ncbi:glycosyltransferase [Serinibacter salmoneus]|uniref:Glycosyl transferase family 2 n=1 Tax=Serinibacter salmoneus TaxID=556530 RepID=A0A2A9CZI0_9MICO|nr:glycosyltransferase [Serinibacter salmoneus]PFG19536.1 glycosyl transferase family 2 [Serinibacter salmoneus]
MTETGAPTDTEREAGREAIRDTRPDEPAATGIACAGMDLADDAAHWLPARRDHTRSRVLVSLHGEVLGYLEFALAPHEVTAALVRQEATRTFAPRIATHLRLEGRRASPGADQVIAPAGPLCPRRWTGGPLPSLTIAVCTRDRADILESCLRHVMATPDPEVEILVIDNAPSDERTADLVTSLQAIDPRLRYHREDRPGLSSARNAALAHASGEVLAFTDDDVSVDSGWASALQQAAATGAGCVTGLVATASVDSPAEAYFDARSPSWSARCEPETFDLAQNRRAGALYPFSAGIFGTGANMAVRTRLVQELGGFDEALGAGTRTRGGEDLDMFVRILLAGERIVYEPSALVWHHHRADDAALLRQLRGYGSGLTAYLTGTLLSPGSRAALLRAIGPGLWRMRQIDRTTRERMSAGIAPPPGVRRAELAGALRGPWDYLRARRRARASRPADA